MVIEFFRERKKISLPLLFQFQIKDDIKAARRPLALKHWMNAFSPSALAMIFLLSFSWATGETAPEKGPVSPVFVFYGALHVF
jgi:hypothetical protein